jgi:hypothetical protein
MIRDGPILRAPRQNAMLPPRRRILRQRQELGLTTQARTILIWMCVLICVNQLGFGAIVPVVALYAEDFGVSQTAIGMTIAIYGLARFLVNVPAGQLANVAGRRVTLATGAASSPSSARSSAPSRRPTASSSSPASSPARVPPVSSPAARSSSPISPRRATAAA